MGEVTDPKSQEHVGYIRYAGKAPAANVINDILDFSKIEAGQVHLEKTPVSIRELTDSISAIINHRAVEKGIMYEAILAAGLA